jgi:hypothetical protein
MPALLDQEIVRGGDRLQARTELVDKNLYAVGMARSLSRHCLNDGEQVLRAMGELTQEQAKMGFCFTPSSDVYCR